MARPHIEFVQAQRLPWIPDGLGAARPGVALKVLSRDAATGELSTLLRYPPGWSRGPEALGVDEELFVLDGRLEGDGAPPLTPDCYAFWPKSFSRGALSTPQGAVVLTFLSGPIAPASGACDPRRAVGRVNLREGEWIANLDAMGLAVMAPHARIRELRSEPETGEITYVTATMPYWRESQPERHPVIQEIFVLAGEVAGNTGIMRAGAYTWRPAHVLHGPYGSTTGAVFFFRSRGGPLTTEHEAPVPFSFDPPHRPVLPPGLEALGREPFSGAERF